ncbi:hypothetical protein C8Q74DRAFT_780386 [Fomes fomentarius]|nr:hypothetical protein C8Q74DRAFT_780386 [Fomes fomentarius]
MEQVRMLIMRVSHNTHCSRTTNIANPCSLIFCVPKPDLSTPERQGTSRECVWQQVIGLKPDILNVPILERKKITSRSPTRPGRIQQRIFGKGKNDTDHEIQIQQRTYLLFATSQYASEWQMTKPPIRRTADVTRMRMPREHCLHSVSNTDLAWLRVLDCPTATSGLGHSSRSWTELELDEPSSHGLTILLVSVRPVDLDG